MARRQVTLLSFFGDQQGQRLESEEQADMNGN